MGSKHTPTTNVCDAFYADKTPANAVALAIADHRANNGGRGSFEFTDALTKAEKQLRAHDDLVAALRDMTRIARAASFGVTGNQPRITKAEAALAKAEGNTP